MSAGTMRDALQILTPTTSNDGRGGQTTTWPTSGVPVWGAVRAATSREQASAGALQTVATHMVLVHFDTRITADKRLKRVGWPGPTLEIVGLRDPDGHRMYMELACAEVI